MVSTQCTLMNALGEGINSYCSAPSFPLSEPDCLLLTIKQNSWTPEADLLKCPSSASLQEYKSEKWVYFIAILWVLLSAASTTYTQIKRNQWNRMYCSRKMARGKRFGSDTIKQNYWGKSAGWKNPLTFCIVQWSWCTRSNHRVGCHRRVPTTIGF